MLPNPGSSKRAGRKIKLRSDWEEIKDGVMKLALILKFSQHPKLGIKLLATEDAYLIEGNDWGDKYWGQVDGEGKNRLGELLMEVREFLK